MKITTITSWPAPRQETTHIELKQRIRYLLIVFIAGLVASGITAFPIATELEYGNQLIKDLGWDNALSRWIATAAAGAADAFEKHPYLAYGTDWLAFAHLVIAVAFLGPLKDPVKNIWVLEFGLIACIGIIPTALLAGHIRGIPLFWQLIDCSFGIVGGIILLICHKLVVRLEAIQEQDHDF